MKSPRLLRVGIVALAAVVLCTIWIGYGHWRHYHATIRFPQIAREVAMAEKAIRPLAIVPHFNPKSAHPFQVDLRWRDATALDLRRAGPDLSWATFDAATRWPAADRMPPTTDFDPDRIMTLGRNPGPGVRALHERGITGRGVGVAVVDQVAPTGHPEYADRLRFYEEADDVHWPFTGAVMHGSAVASIAVGRSVGVAPGADLYYIATLHGYASLRGLWQRFVRRTKQPAADFHFLAGAVRRILRLNAQLPPERRIRVIATAIGWGPGQRGYDEITAATAEARAAGLLVVSSSLERTHGFKFHGLGRAPLADPDRFESYEPGQFWESDFDVHPEFIQGRLLVPMDSRTVAGFTGTAPYVFYRQGGWSWAIPHIAGAFALAAQVKPAITPDEFWRVALATGRVIELQRGGVTRRLGPILDLPALVNALQGAPAGR